MGTHAPAVHTFEVFAPMLSYFAIPADKAFTVTLDNVDMPATKLVIYKDGPWCSFTSNGQLYYTNKPVTIVGGTPDVVVVTKTGA